MDGRASHLPRKSLDDGAKHRVMRGGPEQGWADPLAPQVNFLVPYLRVRVLFDAHEKVEAGN